MTNHVPHSPEDAATQPQREESMRRPHDPSSLPATARRTRTLASVRGAFHAGLAFTAGLVAGAAPAPKSAEKDQDAPMPMKEADGGVVATPSEDGVTTMLAFSKGNTIEILRSKDVRKILTLKTEAPLRQMAWSGGEQYLAALAGDELHVWRIGDSTKEKGTKEASETIRQPGCEDAAALQFEGSKLIVLFKNPETRPLVLTVPPSK